MTIPYRVHDSEYGVDSRPALYITKKGALNTHPQVIQFTSCLPMVGGSLRCRKFLATPWKLATSNFR